MSIAHKHGRSARISRVRCSVERRVRRLADRHPLLGVGVCMVMVVLCFVVVLVRFVATMAVKALKVVAWLTVVIALVVCRNIFRTFPG